jgi:tRNA U34 5-methylaminomethyl-2-thiouridine-forming methyltransferase MnmC
MSVDYKLVTLANGAKTLLSTRYGEKMHPGLGPETEAELLYVRQLEIRQRLKNDSGEFVIWDVGLGAAANAIAALHATRDIAGRLRVVSFDNTSEPLEFALKNAAALGYVAEYEEEVAELFRHRRVKFQNRNSAAVWELHLGDFPKWLERRAPPRRGGAEKLVRAEAVLGAPYPHAIFYDPFSPAKNPAMWTLPLFEGLFRALDPGRPCALTTYSRSTLVRATLLLAGFFVGSGRATGAKEETTIAANDLYLIAEPLNERWLKRATCSDSAEPLRQPIYRREKLSPQTLERLRRHPQFQL